MARYELMRDALGREKQRAERLHGFFTEHRILVLNIMGSPGSGKTTLIEKVIEKLKDDVTISVIEGDLATTVDSERIEKTGADVFQINTGGICHLSP
ncbi:MAG TPA: hydrogenase accessory protein HypB, partial [Firmicutes bacterium]|nr:hydrogenase accessory protein HypB [Bacillota bacterium]